MRMQNGPTGFSGLAAGISTSFRDENDKERPRDNVSG